MGNLIADLRYAARTLVKTLAERPPTSHGLSNRRNLVEQLTRAGTDSWPATLNLIETSSAARAAQASCLCSYSLVDENVN